VEAAFKASWQDALEGQNPRGASGRRPFNGRRRQGTLARVKAWKSGPVVPVRWTRPAGDLGRLTAGGFRGQGNLAATLREGTASKGTNPRSAVGAK
jgi:hypothetical protein